MSYLYTESYLNTHYYIIIMLPTYINKDSKTYKIPQLFATISATVWVLHDVSIARSSSM